MDGCDSHSVTLATQGDRRPLRAPGLRRQIWRRGELGRCRHARPSGPGFLLSNGAGQAHCSGIVGRPAAHFSGLSPYLFERRPKVLSPSSAYGLGRDQAPFPQYLLNGYRTFTTQRLPTEQSRYRELSERGQSPAVMVVGCCDSRVSPEVIFDAGPGELFVVRNVADLVPVYQPDDAAHGVSAALECAVNVLKVKHVVVLGHAQCGGIRAFIDKAKPLSPGDFIGK